MNIAILGAGRVGGTLGVAWARLGHNIAFGVRNPSSQKSRSLLQRAGSQARSATIREACLDAPVVVLATPWDAAREVIDDAGDLSGRTLLDCTNPLVPGLSGLEVGTTTSGAEYVAEWAPGARVVKIFNTVGHNVMADPRFGDERAVMLYCGDSAGAKQTAAELASAIGFEPVDAGPLRQARLLEPFALLWITLSLQPFLDREIAFKLLRRPRA
jgi:predicted dinucleotide-binding enzyme